VYWYVPFSPVTRNISTIPEVLIELSISEGGYFSTDIEYAMEKHIKEH